MAKRYFFLLGAFLCVAYSFVFIRVNYAWYPTYGESDIYAGSALAIVCVLCWLTLEVQHQRRFARPLACRCGYSVKGLKCPECGQNL